MEHIFYFPCLPASPFMDRILFEFNNNFSKRTQYEHKNFFFLCFFCFVIKFKHGFAILARKFAGFHPNLMSKIPCSKWLNLPIFYPDSVLKMHNFSSPISKRLCSISPLLVGPFSCFEHKNTKKNDSNLTSPRFVFRGFHFKNPHNETPIIKYLYKCSILMIEFFRGISFHDGTFTTE
jgi:hypothetical protein